MESVFLGMDPFIEIQSILVGTVFRRLGLGRALMGHAEKWAQEKGFNRIMLSSRVQLDQAHEFYRSIGYGIVKQSYFFSKQL